MSRDLLSGTHVPHTTYLHTQACRPQHYGNLVQWPLHYRAGRGDGGGLDITSAKDMRLLCLLHVLWHIHYWECKWKCSSNMLKNSQGAGRVGLLCFPVLSEGQKAQKEWHSLRPEQERGRALISCLLLMEVRERNFFHWIRKATSGEGGDRPTGQRERRWGFRCSPSWKIVLFSAPFRSFRQSRVTGQLWKCSFEAKHSLFSVFPQDKAKAIRAFYEPSSIKHASALICVCC